MRGQGANPYTEFRTHEHPKREGCSRNSNRAVPVGLRLSHEIPQRGGLVRLARPPAPHWNGTRPGAPVAVGTQSAARTNFRFRAGPKNGPLDGLRAVSSDVPGRNAPRARLGVAEFPFAVNNANSAFPLECAEPLGLVIPFRRQAASLQRLAHVR